MQNWINRCSAPESFFAALHHALNYRDDLSNVKRFGALQQFIFDDSNQVVSAHAGACRA